MSVDLADRQCKPCEGGVEPLRADQTAALLKALHPDWSLTDDSLNIVRTFSFPAYSRSLNRWRTWGEYPLLHPARWSLL